jgi:hypothetical protein
MNFNQPWCELGAPNLWDVWRKIREELGKEKKAYGLPSGEKNRCMLAIHFSTLHSRRKILGKKDVVSKTFRSIGMHRKSTCGIFRSDKGWEYTLLHHSEENWPVWRNISPTAPFPNLSLSSLSFLALRHWDIARRSNIQLIKVAGSFYTYIVAHEDQLQRKYL